MGEWIRTINDNSIPFLLWVQGFQGSGLTSFMRFITYLGTPYFYILFFPFLYWAVSKRLGIYAGLALIIATTLGDWIKWFFQLPRPPSPPVQHLWEETSPGFVSTHASDSAAVWGGLAKLVRRRWFTILALILIFLIGLSRLYLGVHFPADVVGGWLIGLLTLGILFWLLTRLTPRLLSWSPLQQIGGIVLFTSLVLLLFPGDWEGVRPAGDGIRDAGLLFGLLMGLVWDHHSLHFIVEAPWSKKLLRFFLGLILVIVAFFGLDFLFDAIAGDNIALAQALRFVRYAAVGFSVSGLGPWVFQRLRLA